MLDEADESLARGEGISITDESLTRLVDEAKARLRRLLEAERSAARG